MREMKRIISLCVMMFMLTSQAFALEADIKILTKDEIAKLSDASLLEAYTEACVEIEAAKAFHNTSGFMPKEYKNFKDLLRYKFTLLTEIKKRKLEAPTGG